MSFQITFFHDTFKREWKAGVANTRISRAAAATTSTAACSEFLCLRHGRLQNTVAFFVAGDIA